MVETIVKLIEAVLAVALLMLLVGNYGRINYFFQTQVLGFLKRMLGVRNCGWYERSVGRYGAKIAIVTVFLAFCACSVTIDRYFSDEKKRNTESSSLALDSRVSPPPQNGQGDDFERRMAQAQALGRQLARNQVAGMRALYAPKWLQAELTSLDLPPEIRAEMIARRREAAADGRRDAEIYAQQCKWNQQRYDEQREIALNSLPAPVPRADRNVANQLGLRQVYPSGFYGLSKDNGLFEDTHGNRYRVSGGSARKLQE
jgi:hypothetical protein